MKKATFFIGLKDQQTKTQIVPTKKAMNFVEKLGATMFGGGTITKATGIYRHDDFSIVTENSIKFETLDFVENFDELCKEFVEKTKVELNQESILMEIEIKEIVFA